MIIMFLCWLAKEKLYYMSLNIWSDISGSDIQIGFTVELFFSCD